MCKNTIPPWYNFLSKWSLTFIHMFCKVVKERGQIKTIPLARSAMRHNKSCVIEAKWSLIWLIYLRIVGWFTLFIFATSLFWLGGSVAYSVRFFNDSLFSFLDVYTIVEKNCPPCVIYCASYDFSPVVCAADLINMFNINNRSQSARLKIIIRWDMTTFVRSENMQIVKNCEKADFCPHCYANGV